MKNSINRVYDRSVEIVDEIIIRQWQQGRDPDGRIDRIGTQFDQDMNKMTQRGFDELVSAGIVVRSDENYKT